MINNNLTSETTFTPTPHVFPILFGASLHGKRKQWSIQVESRNDHGVIRQSYGYVDGKQIVNERIITAGKNIGKKNETTAFSQAISEARSYWNKKKDAGYLPLPSAQPIKVDVVTNTEPETETETETETNQTNYTNQTEHQAQSDIPTQVYISPLPMLAQDYNKCGKHIQFPCFVQRKLDGIRCVAVQGRGLFSRNGKAGFCHLTHIRSVVDSMPQGTVLDGELYSDDLTFQEIVGIVKRQTLKPGDAEKLNKIHLCVYDIICDGTNQERNERLVQLLGCATPLTLTPTLPPVRLLSTAICATAADVIQYHAKYVEEGYEGVILRNRNARYIVGHRSRDLQKYKEFVDGEYKVVGFKEGVGIESGCVIWICATENAQTRALQEFAVRPRGTREDRAIAFQLGETMVGKALTVRYQELSTDGIPRFPVGIAFRTYE